MSKPCEKCHSKAGHHRLTTEGTLYCLSLNSRGNKMKDARIYRGELWVSAMIGRLPVKYLTQSSYEDKLGQSLQLGLSTTMNGDHHDERQ